MGSTNFDVAAYAIKRVLRILPPYFVALLIFALIARYAVAHGLALPGGLHRLDATGVLGELFFLDGGNQHTNQSFWSLAIEFRWYFLFPLALALWVARPRALLLSIFLLEIAAECTRAASTDIAMLDAFLLGIVAAHVLITEHPIGRYGLGIVLAGALLGLVLETSYRFPVQANAGWHIAAFGFVIYAGQARWLQRVLSSKLLVTIGIGSYSIYLVHEPIISYFVARATPDGLLTAYAAAIGSALAAGAALWWIVERPITDPAFVRKAVAALREELAALMTRWHIPATVELRSSSPALPLEQASVVDFHRARTGR